VLAWRRGNDIFERIGRAVECPCLPKVRAIKSSRVRITDSGRRVLAKRALRRSSKKKLRVSGAKSGRKRLRRETVEE